MPCINKVYPPVKKKKKTLESKLLKNNNNDKQSTKSKTMVLAGAIVLIMCFLLPLLNAEQQSLGTFKLNECVNMIQTCDNCTYINISGLIFPNTTITLINVAMTKRNTLYNYTFCNTGAIGKYIYNTIGDANGVPTVQPVEFEITTTGEKVSLSNIIIVLVFLALAGILFFLGYSFDNSKWIVKTSFYLFALLLGLLSVNSGRIIASESSGLSTMSNMGLLLITSVVSFMFLYMFIFWTIETFRSVKKKREVRWNY